MSHNIEMKDIHYSDRTIWRVNGIELNFDANDADNLERFEDAVEKLKDEENFPRVGKNSEIVRRYCQLFRDFFNRIFGEGTSDKIGIRDNARICNNIYEDFLMFITEQKQDSVEFSNRISSSFNREQRRAISKSSKSTKKSQK